MNWGMGGVLGAFNLRSVASIASEDIRRKIEQRGWVEGGGCCLGGPAPNPPLATSPANADEGDDDDATGGGELRAYTNDTSRVKYSRVKSVDSVVSGLRVAQLGHNSYSERSAKHGILRQRGV